MPIRIDNNGYNKFASLKTSNKSATTSDSSNSTNYDIAEFHIDSNVSIQVKNEVGLVGINSYGYKDISSAEKDFLEKNAIKETNNIREKIAGALDEYVKRKNIIKFYSYVVIKDEESNCPFPLIKEANIKKLEQAENNLRDLTDSNSNRNQGVKSYLEYQKMILRIQKAFDRASNKPSDTIKSYDSVLNSIQRKIDSFHFDESNFCDFMSSLDDFMTQFTNFKPAR